MWLGHRDEPNQILLKDPSLLTGRSFEHTNYPSGHNEGFPDTFKQLYRSIYDYLQVGDFDAAKLYPTFEDGHHEVLSEAILQSHRERRWVHVG